MEFVFSGERENLVVRVARWSLFVLTTTFTSAMV